MNRGLLLAAAALLAGCHADGRQTVLEQGMTRAQQLLLDPRLKPIAAAQKGNPAEKMVEAVFSREAESLWPPRPSDESAYALGNSTQLPSRIVYMRSNDVPWSVVIHASPGGSKVVIDGYGVDTATPLESREVDVSP